MIRLFRNMTRQHVLYLTGLVSFILAQVVLELTVPDYMSSITKLVNTPGSTVSQIWDCGKMMLLFSILAFASSIVARYFSARLAASFSQHLRHKIFQKVESFSMEEIDRFSTASLITRSTNDCSQIQNIMSRALNQLIRVPIMAGYALFKISTRYWQWMAFTAASVSLLVIVLVFLVIYAHPKFRRMQSYTDNLNQVTRENMTGMRVVRAYNAEKYEMDKFSKANDELTENALKARRAMGLMRPAIRFVNNEINIGIYFIGAFLIASSGTAEQLEIFSEMVVFSTYASRIVRAFMGLNMILNMIPRATVSAERINAILDTELSIKDGSETEGNGSRGTLEFRNVSFTYPGSNIPALSDVSFTAKKGETVAFIGATGSGKSTLVNLMMRFFDINAGSITVDGRDIRTYTQHSLREKMGYASQQAVLFTGTVRSNVAYAAEDIEEKVLNAVKIAQASEFVSQMSNGIDSPISRGGTNVSGGQKQRLSIARAVYREPEFYIFDDTFSALDYKTDRVLRAALKKETAGITTFIVAQRIGTIKDADKIIVLDEGRVIDEGTHESLMRTCEIYREIARTQLSQEELA
ncbi:MAG: ABC transporter ATP-binding protein [Erysipelotrichaceae bacterium]|nr:ABC transporter ATP-binding protein [Erysipelotrichaceae bacterium]MBE6116573.1 ABC transporter ATP-binding protein [Erysipelotrichaceae bacterium]